MRISLDVNSLKDYQIFLKVKSLPRYSFEGRVAVIPDEYAALLGEPSAIPLAAEYIPIPGLFDYQADIAALAIAKRKFAVFAECLAGESLIHSPDGDTTIANAFRRGEPMRVYAIDNDRVVIADASAPFINGFGELYRFSLASGRSIISTMAHRFLTPSGWKHAESLRIGERLAASDVGHPQSSSEHAPTIHAGGAQRWIQRLAGSTGRYSPCHHRRDGQLHEVGDISPGSFPSRDGVPERIPTTLHMGASDDGPTRTRQRLAGFRPAIDRCDCRTVPIVAGEKCPPQSSDLSCIRSNTRISWKADSGSIPALQVLEPHPSGGRRNGGGQCVPCEEISIEWDTLVTINYIRTDVFYDMEVPGPACFLSDGIWSHNCGLGKTLILTEFARHAAASMAADRCTLIVSPLMVIPQTIAEVERFYGRALPIEVVKARDLTKWTKTGSGIGITNYDALTEDVPQGNLGSLILDESSMLKSAYGKWAGDCIRLGKGLEWKLALTGTPAPNDRIEYANHAVFLDAFPTVKSFLARFFVNRGQMENRWELKPHALRPFYRALSHWCIFLTNPATYGWKDNAETVPPIHVHVHDVELTEQQQSLAYTDRGTLFAMDPGGITSRSVLSQIAKGNHKGAKVDSLKPRFIRDLVDSWPDESTIIWCHYNEEQKGMAATFTDAANISGDTSPERRQELIEDFKSRRRRVMISKPRILGFGLNLQVATRQVFSGLQDSYEEYHQAVKRSNRVGSTRPLNVHIPITEIERPMIETVIRKANRVQQDTEIQERLFKEVSGPFARYKP